MRTSEEIKDLTAALVKAQAKFPEIKKTKEGQIGNRTFMYAPLDKIRGACDPKLHENDLVVTHGMEPIDGHPYFVTRLTHGTSGQWMESVCIFNPENGEPKNQGKLITYYSRYGYNSLLGLSTEEDTDAPPGNKSNKHAPAATKATSAPAASAWGTGQKGDRITEAQWNELLACAAKNGWSEAVLKKTLKTSFGYKAAKEITVEDSGKILNMILTQPQK